MFGLNFGATSSSAGGGGGDPDAAAYIAAAGITDAAEQAAVNQLVLDLKGTGSTTNNTDVWSDSYTFYPLSPTSLAAAAYNLKDPTLNITWYNSPTHAITGVSGNGTTMYGNTNWNPTTENVDTNNSGLTYSGDYSAADYPMGVVESGKYLALRNNAGFRLGYTGALASAVSYTSAGRVTTSSRTAEYTHKIYKDGVFAASDLLTSSGGSAAANTPMFILAISANGTLTAPFNGEIDFAAAHKGLSDNQAQDLYDAITTYNTAVR